MMKSITRYLVVNISIWAFLAALSSGVVLTSFFRLTVEDNFDSQLDIVLKMLVGELATQLFSSQELTMPGNLGQPRFELPLSGWYWTVSKKEGSRPLFASVSLAGDDISIESVSPKQYRGGIGRYLLGRGPGGKRIRILEREISFGTGESYYFRVTGAASELDQQVNGFQNKAWLLMALFGIVLLVASILLVRTSLKPLHLLQKRVRDVAAGRAETITGDYPREVAGLVDEANLLIASNKDTLERARTQLGNLAHALKTPLSVMTNEVRAAKAEKADLLVQQVDIMRDQIQLYLDRARFAARHNTIGTVTNIVPVLTKLTNVMNKIHPDKQVLFVCDVDDRVSFRGERQDLEEMVGNLVDNACKWASGRVSVSLRNVSSSYNKKRRAQSPNSLRIWLEIVIEDDGPGLDEDEAREALKRGKRLDESKPGSGLGLSIVSEMVGLYQGEFLLDRSELGGLKAILVLPALNDAT
nr:ATP-binding protein [uncultured Cohaesibacter sp.]